MATIVAISREASYASMPIRLTRKLFWPTPPAGRVVLVLAELILVVVLCFYKLDPADQWSWEDVGYRTGFLASCQLPLIVLLAGKNNIIGFLIGASYERLTWLHRWTARMLFLTVTLHMGYWFADWDRYDYIKVKLSKDAITQRGFAAWTILLWIVMSSMAPIRRWNYELFVLQHIVTYVGFLVAVYLHLPTEVKVWVWIPIGLVILDRTLRTLNAFYTNVSVFHPCAKRERFWASKATFEPLDTETTRITIKKPSMIWKPGQHVLLSCHTIAPLQSHPFTVASLPSDGKMEFVVKSKAGSTRRYLRYAERGLGLPVTEGPVDLRHWKVVALEGPYGSIRPLQQFDSVILISGSSGGTFTMPLLRDLIHRWRTDTSNPNPCWSIYNLKGIVTRYIKFVWVVKSRAQYNWFSHQLVAAVQDVAYLRSQKLDVEIEISIYVTCDEDFVSGSGEPQQSTCGTPQSEASNVQTSSPTTSFKEKHQENDTSTQSSSSELKVEPEPNPEVSCEPNGTCCCQKTIEDEDAINATDVVCQCCCGQSNGAAAATEKGILPVKSIHSNDSSDKPLTPANVVSNGSAHPKILTLSGRPQPKNLIRKTLEQALGESAVVVCGPKGMVRNVRQSVVSLSDERAIHKGTGALGMYLHAETFDY